MADKDRPVAYHLRGLPKSVMEPEASREEGKEVEEVMADKSCKTCTQWYRRDDFYPGWQCRECKDFSNWEDAAAKKKARREHNKRRHGGK